MEDVPGEDRQQGRGPPSSTAKRSREMLPRMAALPRMKTKPEKTEAKVTGSRVRGLRSIRIRLEQRQAASDITPARP
jgi:hypothetical protein